MTLKDLLLEYKKRTGCNNDDIAKAIGVNKSTVSRWMKDDVKTPQSNILEKLSSLLQVDVESLIGKSKRYEKPILGIVKAGYGLFATENIEGYIPVSKEDYYRGDYFLRVSGDSMNGAHIFDGDLIYVETCEDLPSGKIGVILIENEEVTVKRIIRKNNLLILEAANPQVETRYFTQDEVETLPVKIIGKVLYSRCDY